MKTTIIREDYVELVGDYLNALILYYFVKQCEDTGEEWIKIKALDLIEELMLSLSRATMQNTLEILSNTEYLKRRRNVDNRCWEYKVNMDKINKDLKNKEF